MKYLFLLILLPLSASAQRAFILHSKVATTTDTTFQSATGLLQVQPTQININGTIYNTTLTTDTTDLYDFEWQMYTLTNGTATVRRTSNKELMEVIIDDGVEVKCYYTR